MTDNRKKAPLALIVQLGDSYGQTILTAEPFIDDLTGNEEFRRCSWGIGGFDAGAELDGFTVHAYIGYSADLRTTPEDTERGLWGASFYVETHRIQNSRQATAITRNLVKVEKSMEKQNAESGYLRDEDFGAYVLRVAKALGIKKIYVRNPFKTRDMSGETFRSVDGAALQYYVSSAVTAVQEGKKSNYVHTR